MAATASALATRSLFSLPRRAPYLSRGQLLPRFSQEGGPVPLPQTTCSSFRSVVTEGRLAPLTVGGGCGEGGPPGSSCWRPSLVVDSDRRCGRRRLHSRGQRSISTPTSDLLGGYDLTNPDCNVPPSIVAKLGTQLHRRRNHPLQIITTKIHEYFQTLPPLDDVNSNHNNDDAASAADPFPLLDDLSPVVTAEAAFDALLIPTDHPSRSRTDTYYLNQSTLLRPHTSAHQVQLLKRGTDASLPLDQFLVAGDVYRRDEIDKSHYPVFHQMEGVKLFHDAGEEAVQLHLRGTLEGLAMHLFGDNVPMRWVDAYFPFTSPSYELEIYYDDSWMEVLGCGVIHPQVLQNAGRIDSIDDARTSGWAFGLGLERLAMVLFDIPDIRLFWSHDERFLSQFASGHIVQFQPYSKYPPVYKDVSFWLPGSERRSDPGAGAAAAAPFHSNDVYEVIRNVGGDWIEQVSLLDEFVHPTSGRESHCYRVTWRSMDRNLTNEEIDELQSLVRQQLSQQLGAELR